MSEGVVKAKFVTEMGNTFKVQYNPTDIQLNASSSWQQLEQIGNETQLEFKSVSPRKLSMTLLFDTTTNNEDVSKVFVNHLMDVFQLRTGLPDISRPNADGGIVGQVVAAVSACGAPASGTADGQGKIEKGRNQKISFYWGEFSFEGVLQSLDTKYMMFSKDGYPIRAEVKLVLQEFKHQWETKLGGTRPDVTVPQVKLVQLQSGQTLSSMASMLGMGVSALASMNGIPDPMNVPPGQVIRIPGN
jgi:hypothetical protein